MIRNKGFDFDMEVKQAKSFFEVLFCLNGNIFKNRHKLNRHCGLDPQSPCLYEEIAGLGSPSNHPLPPPKEGNPTGSGFGFHNSEDICSFLNM
jgi:hypothetical protein